jgi:hypothetical protein
VRYKNLNIFKYLPIIILIQFSLGSVWPTSARQIEPPPPNLPEDTYKVYLPATFKSPDYLVGNMEVTQAIQNINNTVSLVAGRNTLVRVYARSLTSSIISNVTATLKGYKDGNYLGEVGPLSGSAYPYSYSTNSMRADKNKTFNFQIPTSWISSSGNVELQAALGDGGLAPESGNSQSSLSQTFLFNSVPSLNVIVIPVRLYDPPEYQTGFIFGPEDTGYTQDAIYRMYPVPSVNITNHDVFNFVGDMASTDDWDVLLDKITSLRFTEGCGYGCSNVYYGVIPLKDKVNQFTWFSPSGGILGLGNLGQPRAAIGVSNESIFGYQYGVDTISHEVGHTLGRLHTPGCGASYTDKYYPYPNGVIGQFGFRFSDQTIQPYTDNDIMNYCDNQWISDYTYQGLYNDQKNYSNASELPYQDSVFVRVKLNSDGTAKFQPTYSFQSKPSISSNSGEYRVNFVAESGEILAEYPVDVTHAEDYGISTTAIYAILPQPEKPYSAIRLLDNGQEVSTRDLSSTGSSLSSAATPLLSEESGLLVLSWGSPNLPALVRYTTNGGVSWSTIAFDHVGGELKILTSDLPTGSLQFQIVLADNAQTYSVEWLR